MVQNQFVIFILPSASLGVSITLDCFTSRRIDSLLRDRLKGVSSFASVSNVSNSKSSVDANTSGLNNTIMYMEP